MEVFDTLNNETKVYPSIAEAARAMGVTKASISMAFKRFQGAVSNEGGASTI